MLLDDETDQAHRGAVPSPSVSCSWFPRLLQQIHRATNESNVISDLKLARTFPMLAEVICGAQAYDWSIGRHRH